MIFPRFVNRGKLIPSVVCLTLFIPILEVPPARGEDENPQSEVYLEVTATTPSRLEEPVKETSGSVSILTQPEIEVQNPVTVPEVLRDLPGVSLQESGTVGESAVLSLRGTEPSQTLILLDGVRLNPPFLGRFDLGNFFTDEIGQVEIVRGAQSALYGSDAVGGVVNLRTRRPVLPKEISVTLGAGNFKTFRETLSVGGKQTQGDYRLTVSRTDSGGQFDHDRYGGTAVSAEAGLNLGQEDRLEIVPRAQWDRKELAITDVPGPFSEACTDKASDAGNCVEFASDVNRELERTFFFDVLKYDKTILPWWSISLTGAVVKTHLDEDNPPEPGAADPAWSYFEETETTETTLNLQQNFVWLNGQVFTLGVEYVSDRVDAEISAPVIEELTGPFPPIDRGRANAALYLQQLWKRDKDFTLQAGVRIDKNSQFGRAVNPKVSSAYTLARTGTRLRAGWGTGFRAPTFQALYFPLFGNPDLDPEKSWSWEAGIRQPVLGETLILDVLFFRIDYKDLIQQTPGFENIGDARTQGVESVFEVRVISSMTVKANYTYLAAEDQDSDQRLPFRPRHQGNISLLYAPTVNFSANLDVNMVSSQALTVDMVTPDGSLLTGDAPGYARVDLSATYDVFGRFFSLRETRFFVRIQNLLDREYQEIPGFPAPGIHFLAGLTGMF
jgi:vitamin B12 transporter